MTRLLWLLGWSVVLAPAAHAVDRTVCVRYDVDYVDSDLSSGEDYFATNGFKDARGIQIKLTNNTTSAVSLGFAGDDGCADFTGVSVIHTYEVRLQARAQIDGNTVTIRNSSGGAVWGKTLDATHSFAGPTVHAWDATFSRSDIWNTLAATSFALHRSAAGLTGMDVDYFMEDNSGTLHLPTGCTAGCIVDDDVWIEAARTDNKFALAYTLGWVILNHLTASPTSSTTADATHCGQSPGKLRLDHLADDPAAATEGFALWYAASAFNKTSETDCSFNYWKSANWDRLGTCYAEDEMEAHHTISCADGPGTPPMVELVPPRNYRAYCAQRAPGFSLPDDTSVPYDVVRFWMHLLRDGELTRQEVGEVMEEAYTYGIWSALPYVAIRAAADDVADVDPEDTFDPAAQEHGLLPP